jgi:uncharacterized protein
MPLSSYCIRFSDPESDDRVIIFSTRTAAAVTMSRDAVNDLERNQLSSEELENLAGTGLLASSLEAEQQEMLGYIDALNRMTTTIKPIIVMNLDCNLACSYCFEGNRKGKYFLSMETADEFVRFIGTRLTGKNIISPVFYGGEPLLSVHMIARLSRMLRDLADTNGAGYEFGMITNGTLLNRPLVERLRPLGFRAVNVTLDGPRDVHNISRPFKSGAGSFDTIVRNLRDVCGLIDVHLGGNYTRDNYREFPLLLDHLLLSGLGPDRIASVEFSPVLNESPEFVPDFRDGCLSAGEPWAIEAGMFLRHETLSRGFRVPPVEPAVCMIERNEHFVVNWNGEFYKCPCLIGRKDFCAGTVRSGMHDCSKSHNLGNWKSEPCLSCVYLPLCFGGCRYIQLLRTGSMLGVECKKEFFDRSLPELVLQDMARVAAAAR